MTTTIALETRTRQRLAALKEEWDAGTYDEVVRRLIDAARPVPASMFGADPSLPHLTRKLRNEMMGGERKNRR